MSRFEQMDLDEFKLFIKYNNRKERKHRHVDLYYVDHPDRHDLIRINEEKLKKDTLEQMARMKAYFSADFELNELIDYEEEQSHEED